MGYETDFPLLMQAKAGQRRLVYLDSAATTQKANRVLEAERNYYRDANANPHRGQYALARYSTDVYESSRAYIAQYVNAASSDEIIFTRNATEAINLVAYSFGLSQVKEGDEIALLISEHHSNLLPWQMVAQKVRARLVYLIIDRNGRISESELEEKIRPGTKIVAAAGISNTLGTRIPLREIADRAHEAGAVTCFDYAQVIAHEQVDLRQADADFAAFSGHKAFGPMGIGFLYGKRGLLEQMEPFLRGGGMVDVAGERMASFNSIPAKFEAGTQNVPGAYGLSEALRYIEGIGLEKIAAYERSLLEYLLACLTQFPKIRIYGNPCYADDRCGIVSFNYRGISPHRVAELLDADGIAIRAGAHCAQPLLGFLGVTAMCRVSLSLYNSKEDIQALAESLSTVVRRTQL